MPPEAPLLLRRHNEIRAAITFFLNQFARHRQAGSEPDASRVLRGWAAFRGLEAVTQHLHTAAPQVHAPKRQPRGGKAAAGGGGGGPSRRAAGQAP